MARGARFPLRITPRGGVALTSATDPAETLRQVIAVSLYPGQNRNPFAPVKVGGGTYRTPASDGAIIAEIRRRFGELESQGRARIDGGITTTPPDDTGRRRVVFKWLDLETGVTRTEQVEV